MADLLTEEEIQALLEATEVQTIEEEKTERLCGKYTTIYSNEF